MIQDHHLIQEGNDTMITKEVEVEISEKEMIPDQKTSKKEDALDVGKEAILRKTVQKMVIASLTIRVQDHREADQITKRSTEGMIVIQKEKTIVINEVSLQEVKEDMEEKAV